MNIIIKTLNFIFKPLEDVQNKLILGTLSSSYKNSYLMDRWELLKAYMDDERLKEYILTMEEMPELNINKNHLNKVRTIIKKHKFNDCNFNKKGKKSHSSLVWVG